MDKKSQAHMTKELLRWKLKLCDVFYVPRFAMLICIMVNNGSASCKHGQYMHMFFTSGGKHSMLFMNIFISNSNDQILRS